MDRCSHWSQCTEWNRGNVTYVFPPLFFWWEIIELLVSVEPHVLKSVHKWVDSESRSQPKLSCRDSKNFRPPSGSTRVWLTLVLNPDGGGSPSCITQRRLRTRGLAQRQSHCSVSHSKLWWLWITFIWLKTQVFAGKCSVPLPSTACDASNAEKFRCRLPLNSLSESQVCWPWWDAVTGLWCGIAIFLFSPEKRQLQPLTPHTAR